MKQNYQQKRDHQIIAVHSICKLAPISVWCTILISFNRIAIRVYLKVLFVKSTKYSLIYAISNRNLFELAKVRHRPFYLLFWLEFLKKCRRRSMCWFQEKESVSFQVSFLSDILIFWICRLKYNTKLVTLRWLHSKSNCDLRINWSINWLKWYANEAFD